MTKTPSIPSIPATLASMSLADLVKFHNTFTKVLPDLKPLKAASVKSKADLILKLSQLSALRPAHIAELAKITPFSAREALRAAAANGAIQHEPNKPWSVSPIEYAVVFMGSDEEAAQA